jgi:ferredoxin-NADP reductase
LGETGRISEQLLKKYINNTQVATYYISGPAVMVDNTKSMLTQMQIPEEQIIIEKFTGY